MRLKPEPAACSLGGCYLAFDLGAESGRLLLGEFRDGRLETIEVHRFPNRMLDFGGSLHWDVHALFREMKEGLRLCAESYTRKPASIGIDTWGVDFGLLNEGGYLIDLPFTYRDRRTAGAIEEFTRIIPRERLYQLTGVQIVPINTLFQLHGMHGQSVDEARDLLFMPDLFNYFLTGVKQSEFTFATTSQLYNPGTGTWEKELFSALDIPIEVMQRIAGPGSKVGLLADAVTRETGLEPVPVIAVASHDTASAVAATPAPNDRFAYISSGTWSLMGIESPVPLINERTYRCNFTNEGGVGHTFRVLKNITGLWLLQECRRQCAGGHGQTVTYDELVGLARDAEPFRSVFDPDDPAFINPPDMTQAIANCCRATDQPVPETVGQITRGIFESLALAYRHTLDEILEIREGPAIEQIHVIGGGARNTLLCQMTADATDLPVCAGPAEAAAVGNLLVQAMAAGEIASLAELREVVRHSFPPTMYEPHRDDRWGEAYHRFVRLRGISSRQSANVG